MQMSFLHIKKTNKRKLQNVYHFVFNNTMFSFDTYFYFGIKFTLEIKPFLIKCRHYLYNYARLCFPGSFRRYLTRARIFELLRSPGIDSNPPAYVAWRAGTITLFLLGSWPP
jgi:hypothetical protein